MENENVIRLLEKKKTGKWEITEDKVNSFGNAGVWAMYGRNQPNSEWQLLEVAETQNIRDEIVADTNIICNYENFNAENDKKFYKFRVWSAEFTGRGLIKRYYAKYYHIGSQYKYIKMELVIEEDSIDERYKAEVKTAMEDNAIYWYPAPVNKNRSKNSQWAEVKKYEDKK